MAFDHAQVIGNWKVIGNVYGEDRLGESDPESGKVLTLGLDQITDPFNGNCKTPDYEYLKITESKIILKGPGKFLSSAMKKKIKTKGALLYGFLICGGMNHSRMAFLSENEALYFFEGENIFLLKKSQ